MKPNKVRFSRFIRPFSFFLDLLIINWFCFFYIHENIFFHLGISIAWVVISVHTSFYEIYRYTKPYKIVYKIIKQYILFLLCNFLFAGLLSEVIKVSTIFIYISSAFLFVLFVKFFIHYFLKFFRINYGGNYRNVVIVGDKTNKLADFFTMNPDFGYVVTAKFSSEETLADNFSLFFHHLEKNTINEIYVSTNSFSNNEMYKITSYADNNLIRVKLILDKKSIFSRNLNIDYFNDLPIVSLRSLPLDNANNRIIKRGFDLVFSFFVLLFILSWLIPVLGILIKLESPGPILFSQKRHGLNNKLFNCYKFRSMHLNSDYLVHVNKNDSRVTKIGAFIRRTSIDELPQFINVLLGDMSVVGPRPHMTAAHDMYLKIVDKYMVRHFIKTGITGLAQISGYRGEVEKKSDIINRVKYDTFYAENWSILFDVKIIIKTVINAVRGEEKAY